MKFGTIIRRLAGCVVHVVLQLLDVFPQAFNLTKAKNKYHRTDDIIKYMIHFKHKTQFSIY